MKRLRRGKFVYFYCLILCMALFLTACGKDGTSDRDAISDTEVVSGESIGTNIASGREWVYVPEVITVEDDHADYGRMQPVGDTICYVSLGREGEDSAKSICRYSMTDRELTTVPIHWPEGGNDWDVGYRFFTQDQELYMTANVYPADSGSMKRFLCRVDADGNCLSSRDITEQAGRNVSLCGLNVDSQGRIYLFVDNGEILLYTEEGDYHGAVRYDSQENQVPARIRGACEGADGKFYVCISQGSLQLPGEKAEGTEDVRCTLMEIDFENARLLEAVGNLPNINGLCEALRRGNAFAGKGGESAGQGSDSVGRDGDFAGQDGASTGESGGSDSQYDLLLYDDRAVYGYRFDTQKSDSGSIGEELFAWMDSDINGYCVTNLYLMADGRLCATVEDWMNDDRVVVALERTKAEQAPGREELVLVTVDGGSDLAAMVVKFNRGNGRYHLTVKSYGSLTDLYNAVLTKEPMDLIDLSDVNVQKLTERGLIEDLTPYVDRSEMFERSDFVDGILDAYTVDNTLVGIPAEFMVQTVVGRKDQLENKAGLTLEELFSIGDRYPGARAFDGITKEEVMQYLMMFNEDAFIDGNTGVCHFDSDRFQEVLQYVNQFPDELVSGKEEDPLSVRIQNGEVLFLIEELYPPFILSDYVKMFGEEVACVGFPTADGKGGHLMISSDAYAIAAVSEHKESAWSFIEEVITQEKEGELYKEFWLTYPSMKKTLGERAEAAIKRDELGREELDALLELLPDATPFFSVKEDEIIKIINEEAPAYYSGQKGAGDVAGIIQNRVQLYVNENR